MSEQYKIKLASIVGPFKKILKHLECSNEPVTKVNYIDLSFNITESIPIVTYTEPVLSSSRPLYEHINLKYPNQLAYFIPTPSQNNVLDRLTKTYLEGIKIDTDDWIYLVDLIFIIYDVPLIMKYTHDNNIANISLDPMEEPPLQTNFVLPIIRNQKPNIANVLLPADKPLKFYLDMNLLSYDEKIQLNPNQVNFIKNINGIIQ